MQIKEGYSLLFKVKGRTNYFGTGRNFSPFLHMFLEPENLVRSVTKFKL